MKIYKNFLDDNSFNKILSTINSPFFSWYYNEGVVKKNDRQAQLIHTFFDKDKSYINSEHFVLLQPIINIINPFVLLRVKANLTIKTEKHIEQGYHSDFEKTNNFKITTALFYINTNNGYTLFENGKKIKSIKNTLFEFDGEIKHTGVTNTDTLNRVVINFNYIKQ